MARYAQDASFWTTTVTPEKSNAEIQSYLSRNLKADEIMVVWSTARQELVVLFLWGDVRYRMSYRPLALKPFTGSEAKRKQAILQMYRRALNHLKLIVDLAQEGHEEVLLPYTPMLGEGGVTIQQAGVKGLEEMLRNPEMLALPAPVNSEFEEVKD